MDNEQIRQTLQSEEQRLSAMRDGISEDSELDADEQLSSGGELSNVDQHPADIGTEVNQREVNLSMVEQIEAELGDVEAALRKLDDGSYGKCEACGKDIGEDRLEALPSARFCVDDQSKAEEEISLRSTVDSAGVDTGATSI